MILLLLFRLSRWVLREPDVVDFYVFCIHFALQRPNPTPYRLNLYKFVVKYYHIFSNNIGKHWILAINQHKDKWHSVDDFTTAILFIASSTAGTSRCWFLRLLHIFCVATKKSYTVLIVLHIVFVFNIYNTFAVIMTNKPQLFISIVFFYYILPKKYRRTLCLHHQLSHR